MYAQQCVQPTGTNRPRAWGSCSLWKARGVVGDNTLKREHRRSPMPAACCGTRSSERFPVAIAAGSHPFPSRTRKLSLPAPMVLGGRLPGRVGRRRNSSRTTPTCKRRWALSCPWRGNVPACGQFARCPGTASRPRCGSGGSKRTEGGDKAARSVSRRPASSAGSRIGARAPCSQAGRGRRAAARGP